MQHMLVSIAAKLCFANQMRPGHNAPFQTTDAAAVLAVCRYFSYNLRGHSSVAYKIGISEQTGVVCLGVQ